MILEGKFYPRGSKQGEKITGGEVSVTPGGSFGSFIRAVRSRKPQDNNADAEVAHYSAALCHLANISYRLGTSVPYSQAGAKLGDNKQVVESFGAIRDNLQAIGMKLEETNYMLGRKLALDPQAEQFVGEGAAEANPLLTRPYRAPFVVPENV
jgi:hypothetical protein